MTKYIMVKKAAFKLAIASIAVGGSVSCYAESLPLWEIGAGIGALSLPDYRGSDERSNYVLPVPYVVYRGDWLKADRNGVRSTLFESDRLEVNLSVNATQPVRSKGNFARRGMADLKPTVEFGPTMDINLFHTPDKKLKFDFRMPLRAAMTVESSPKVIGWLASPSLNLDLKDPGHFPGWNLGLVAGMLINNRKYNQYFYSVSPGQALADRPAYSAPGGFAGSQFTLALSKRYARHWVGAFLRYDSLRGATFADSPLVRKPNALLAGIAVSWVFDESSVRVEAQDR